VAQAKVETAQDEDNEVCVVCKSDGHHDKLLLCDSCTDGACHTFCMVPPLSVIPDGAWFCETCKQAGVEDCKPLTAPAALEAARLWYDTKSFFGVQGLRMQPLKAYFNSGTAWSISYTTNPPTEGSPYLVRAEFARKRQADNSFVWSPESFDEEGASMHRDGQEPQPSAAAAEAGAPKVKPPVSRSRRIGDRVMSMFLDGHTYPSTIVAVHKLSEAADGKPPAYMYTIDWDDGDPSCRQRSEDQVFTPGEHPDKDEDDQMEIAPVEPAAAAVEPAATSGRKKGIKRVAATAAAPAKRVAATAAAPAAAAASSSSAAAAPAAARSSTVDAGSGSVPVSVSRTGGRIRKRKEAFDPEVENGRPQWAKRS
jgi:hypothetical protein